MSHFKTVAIALKSKDCLIRALKDLGFKPEVHKEAVALYDYHGDLQYQTPDGKYVVASIVHETPDARLMTAEIIIRREQIGSASNDVGFKWDAKSKAYQMIRSEYDESAYLGKCSDKSKFVENLKMRYGHHQVYDYAEQNGLAVSEELNPDTGLKRYRLTKQAMLMR